MEELDLKEIISMLWRNKILIIVLTIIGLVIGYVYNAKLVTPKYKSSTSIILSVNKKTSEDASINPVTRNDIILNQELTETYTQLIKSEKVLEQVKTNLNLEISQEQISKSIKVEKQNDSTVLKITVESGDAQTAKIIAEEITQVFFKEVKELYALTSSKVLDYPKLEEKPYNINPIKYAAIGAIGGMVIAILICFVKTMLNDNIKSEADVEKYLKIPVLASIGKSNIKANLVTLDPRSADSEVFRVLISNIKYLKSETILVTSSCSGEGKSWIASNIATTYAKSGKKVLLIDSDMRRGRQHQIFNIKNVKGLSNIIENGNENINLKDYVNESVLGNLDILTNGSANIDYSKLLFSSAMQQIINMAKLEYQYIIIDGTPNSLVADDMMISNLVDSTMLVVKYDNTSAEELKKIKTRIERSGGNVMGVVLNQVPGISKKYEQSYYSYSKSNSLQVMNSKLKIAENLKGKAQHYR